MFRTGAGRPMATSTSSAFIPSGSRIRVNRNSHLNARQCDTIAESSKYSFQSEDLASMRYQVALPIALIACFAVAMPLLAHHSFAAEFDSNKVVTLQGKFTKMDWVNPHSWIHMETVDKDSGKVETWDIETGPPNT